MDAEQLAKKLQQANQNPTNDDYWQFLAHCLKDTIETAGLVILDRARWERVLHVAIAADRYFQLLVRHEEGEGGLSIPLHMAMDQLRAAIRAQQPGDLDPVGEGE